MTADDPEAFDLPTLDIRLYVEVGTRRVGRELTVLVPPPQYSPRTRAEARRVIESLLAEVAPVLVRELHGEFEASASSRNALDQLPTG